MVMSINTNSGAMAALQNLSKTSQSLETTQLRITTGLRVNGPKDDAATFAIAQNMSISPVTASVSFKASSPILELRRLMLPSSLRTRGRSEISKKMPDIQRAVTQYIFQKEM